MDNDPGFGQTLHGVDGTVTHSHNTFIKVDAHGYQLRTQPLRNLGHGNCWLYLNARTRNKHRMLRRADKFGDARRVESTKKMVRCHFACSTAEIIHARKTPLRQRCPKKTRRRTDDKDQGGLATARHGPRTPAAAPFGARLRRSIPCGYKSRKRLRVAIFLGSNTDSLHIDRDRLLDREVGS